MEVLDLGGVLDDESLRLLVVDDVDIAEPEGDWDMISLVLALALSALVRLSL